jgi:hypothetical protein
MPNENTMSVPLAPTLSRKRGERSEGGAAEQTSSRASFKLTYASEIEP